MRLTGHVVKLNILRMKLNISLKAEVILMSFPHLNHREVKEELEVSLKNVFLLIQMHWMILLFHVVLSIGVYQMVSESRMK